MRLAWSDLCQIIVAAALALGALGVFPTLIFHPE
jgi:hypothetical protein